MFPYYIYLFGFLPSLVWLLFYLRKDAHPEPNSMVLKVFFLGMVAGFYALLAQIGVKIAAGFSPLSFLKTGLFIFLINAFIEEISKYGVVRLKVIGNKETDEGFDIILYMIISGLGFAALENIFNLSEIFTSKQAIILMAWRSISATFLHALCSATIGLFLAFSFYRIKHHQRLFWQGVAIATVLHALYNFSIMEIGTLAQTVLVLNKEVFWEVSFPYFLMLGAIFLFLFSFVSWGIKKIKRLKNVCLLND